jgi:hypothetical protein
MASRAHRLCKRPAEALSLGRVYAACCFDTGLVVPRVKLLEANTDAEAITELCSSDRRTRRELWDGYRLVAAIPPDGE